ncbi:MAG: peptide deformylase [Sphingobacteriales bacterium]|nr:MAG: peptide deformylase [Sphingobacteriales bacterium]
MRLSLFKILLTLFIPALLITSCATKSFTAAERQLIATGKKNDLFRVLSIANKQDSIILRKRSRDLKQIKDNKDLVQLLARMKVTMDAEDGIGIAAPQVGINRNIFLFTRIDEPEQKVQVAINPRITTHSDSLVCFERDGCLSIPDIRGNSKRYAWIEVSYYDENGTLIKERFSGHKRPDNFTNIIFQHEYDHINGILFIDKLCE